MRWFRFPREFFVSGVTCSAPRIALETLLACFAVAWRHRESSPLLWSCWARYSVVLRLWHGLGLLWLVSLWESSGPASRSALRALERAVTSSGAPESCKRRREEGGRVARASFLNSPFFWTSPKVAGPIRVSVWGEAPPARLLLQGIFHAVRNNFYPCIKTLIRFTHYNITFVILLIHILLQPFIKV